MKFFWIIIFSLLTAMLFAENKLPNSSFELGDAGYRTVTMQYVGEPFHQIVLPETDTVNFVHGRASLHFADPAGDKVEFMSPEFPLTEAARQYTLSVWAKSDRPTKISLDFFWVTHHQPDVLNRWHSASKSFDINQEWTRCVFTFDVPAEHRYGMVKVTWRDGAVNLDAMQLESGPAKNYAPLTDVEFAFAKTNPIIYPGPREFTLGAVNYTKTAQIVKATLSLPEQKPSSVSMDLPPGSVKSQTVNVDFTRYGAVELGGNFECGTVKGSVIPFRGGVIHRLAETAVNPETTFAVGYSSSFPLRNVDNKHYFRALEVDFDQMAALLRQQGVRILRLHDDDFNWPSTEPEKGKFNWTSLDRKVAAAQKHGLIVMPVLGYGAFLAQNPDKWQDWFVRKNSRKTGTFAGRNCYSPAMADWRDYCQNLFAHFKGKILYYEILNEPNLYVKSDEYVPYLKTAFEVAREVDPTIKIVGICSTGDLGGDLGQYINECGKLGAMQWLDIVSFHPYSAQLDSSAEPAAKQIADIRKLVDQYRKNVPLWNTELYYIHSAKSWRKVGLINGQTDWIAAGQCRPAFVVRREMIDLGNGVGQSVAITGDHTQQATDYPHFGYTANWVEGASIPGCIWVANNAFASFLEGAKVVRALSLIKGVGGYAYLDRDGRKIAAVWAIDDDDIFHVTLPAAAKAYDLYGNALPQTFDLGPDPVYVTGVEPEALRITPDRPYALVGMAGSARQGKPAVAAEFRNNGKTPLILRGRLKGGVQGAQNLTIPGESAATFWFECDPVPEKPQIMILADGKQDVCEAVITPKKYAVNGETVKLADGSKFQLQSAPGGLTFNINVPDDVRGNNVAGSPWEGDGVELFFDLRPDSMLDRTEYHDRVFRLFVTPQSANGLPQSVTGSANLKTDLVKWQIHEDGAEFSAQVFIPWAAFGESGPAPLAFDIVVNDSDGGKRARSSAWAGNQYNWRDRFNFGRLLEK